MKEEHKANSKNLHRQGDIYWFIYKYAQIIYIICAYVQKEDKK